jgi:hypothetical protein
LRCRTPTRKPDVCGTRPSHAKASEGKRVGYTSRDLEGTCLGRLRLKQVTASALSLWLGFLACVLGCAQPVFASVQPTQPRTSELKAAASEDDNDRAAGGGSCCHHRGKTPDKNETGTSNSSCCHWDATLVQKQDPAPPSRTCFSVLALPLFALHVSVPLSVSTEKSGPIPRQAGRDVLLEAHVLRI